MKCILSIKESDFNAKNGSKFSRLPTRKRLLQQKVDKTRRSTVETQIKVKDTLKYKQVYTSRVFLCQSYAYLMPILCQKAFYEICSFFTLCSFFPGAFLTAISITTYNKLTPSYDQTIPI